MNARVRCALPYVAIAVVALVAYARTFGFGFVYDDDVITRNSLMQEPGRVFETWTSPFYGRTRTDIDVYRPLTAWSFALNWKFEGLLGLTSARGATFHVVNALLNALAACFVCAWIRVMGRPITTALAAGLLFGVLPIHVEAVANVYGRSEPMAVVFGLAYLIAARRSRPFAAGFALLLALWSKESALAFVPLALASDYLMPIDGRRFRPMVHAGAVVAIVVFIVLRDVALQGVVPRPVILENPLAGVDTWPRILTAARIQLDYLRLCVWPFGLSTDYSFDQIPIITSVADARVLGFALVVILAVTIAALARKRRPDVTLAVFVWPCLFAVTANFLMPVGTCMGERLAYAPSIAIAWLAGSACQAVASRLGALVAGALIALATGACAFITMNQSAVWSDDLTLFRAQVASAPASARSHLNLGIALSQHGDDVAAIPEIEQSLRIWGPNSHGWYCLGVARFNVHQDPPPVIQAFENALKYGPSNNDARAKLAIVFARCGRKEDGLKMLDELTRLAPDHPLLPQIKRLLQ